MYLHLVTGYRGTGKDTLQKATHTHQIEYPNHKNTKLPSTKNTPVWLVYSDPYTTHDVVAVNPCHRVAFADTLKRDTHAYLGLPQTPASYYESVKDTMIIPDPVSKQMKSMRHHYIDYGQLKKQFDSKYWCRQVLGGANYPIGSDVMITDCRFPEEVTYAEQIASKRGMKLYSWRVYRETVPVPLAEEKSEHSLDSWLTDVLLVITPAEFDKAVQLFPQYSQYKLCSVLVPRDTSLARKDTET